MRLSIRWRLTLWNGSVLALVLLAFAGVVYWLSANGLYRQVDDSLQDGLRQIKEDKRLLTSARDRRLAHWVEELDEHTGLLCAISKNGDWLAKSPGLDSLSLVQTTTETKIAETQFPGGERFRILIASLSIQDEIFVIQILAPLHHLDQALSTLRTVLAMAIPLALLVCGGVGLLLTRKALAPVDQLRRATEEVTADHLDRRLPLTNPEDELGLLTRTINSMIDRLEKSFHEIRRFTADASHELRTPLTALRTELEVALKSETREEVHQLLSSLLEECHHLTRLTDQLLTLSREDAGIHSPKVEQIDLMKTAQNVVENMRPLAEMKGIDLQCEGASIQLSADEGRLRQVLYNLVDNAIKCTAQGSVRVKLQRRESSAVLSVTDTGSGIPSEHQARVFDRFYRVDKGRSRAEGGTGLGLSIAQSIVRAHGGEITLESVVGQGTCFVVRIPLKPEGEQR